ncbi:MAG: hypothetical protein KGJ79_12840 [Alphaproteobacteria bacterium]|nr:hypothetical protein [Alphaproteobacteria bacterium]
MPRSPGFDQQRVTIVAVDRAVRSLVGLAGASSSRVLNLAAIALAQADNPKHRAQPFFNSPVINGSIILKHRLRSDEMDFFVTRRAIATKVIIPFETSDLRSGGRSLFVGQRSYETLLREVGNYSEKLDMKQDLEVLRLIDGVPSLDPFLLREHLNSHDIAPDSCYFSISDADQQRMFNYAAQEVRQLTALALSGKGGQRSASTDKIVAALLSNEVTERLEPLRMTLQLDPAEFVEGIFSWRGFLYYKWSMEQFWPNTIKVLRDIKTFQPTGKINSDQTAYLAAARRAIIVGVKDHNEAVRRLIAIYDNAYAQLVGQQDPKTFREFLLNAPSLFLEMGEKIGAISHITSFWQYRFSDAAPRFADPEELITIFQDFSQSFGVEVKLAA